jgi:putative ABC transport system substrate-binding protein
MTSRRGALMALPLLGAWPSARAQPPTGPPKRLGVISVDPDSPVPPAQRRFYKRLRRKGWMLGENLLREAAYADGKFERLPALAEELARRPLDVILALSDQAAVAAARATHTIPIVFTNVFFPVETGLVDSLARPGRNATGQSLFAGTEIFGKRLAYLREIAPAAKRQSYLVALGLGFPTVAGGFFDSNAATVKIAASLGFETRIHRLLDVQSIDAVFDEIAGWGAQALTAGRGWHLAAPKRVAELLLQHRLPSSFLDRVMVENGALLSYGVGQSEVAYAERRLVEYVDQVLRGVSPATLPVEQPNRYELVINLKTAIALGLTVPRTLLVRADELIQ